MRRAERERRLRRMKLMFRLRVLGAVVAILLVAGGAWALYRSDVFSVSTVRIEGTRSLTDDSVRGLAGVPSSATLLRLPVDSIEERLEASPWIASATVSRDFPDTVVLTIVERIPAAILDLGEGGRWLVDSGAWVIAEPSADTTVTLPVVRDLSGIEPVAGGHLDSEVVGNALAILKGMSPELLAMMRVMSAPSIDLTSIYTVDDVQVFFGSAEDTSKKDIVARQLLAERAGPLLYINVRDPDRPTSREIDGN